MLPCSARGLLGCSAALPRGSCWQSRELVLCLSSGALVGLGLRLLDCRLACSWLMGMSCCLSALFLPCGKKKKKKSLFSLPPLVSLIRVLSAQECKSWSCTCFCKSSGFASLPCLAVHHLLRAQSPELLLRARLLGQTCGAVPRLPLLSVPRLLRDLTRGDLFLCTVFKLAWGRGPALSLWRTRRSPAASCPCSCISP